MKELPANKLDPRIKVVWRISDAASITMAFVGIALAVGFMAWLFAEGALAVALGVVAAAWAVVLVVWMAVVIPLRYVRWRYELSPEYLDIARGIIVRKRFIVPFIRVQNTDTRQGPILRMCGLASVTVSTAAGEHVIPGLRADEAEELRDRAAEFARLAREDV